MIEKFVFPLPPTLNEIIGTARSNIYASAKEKRNWTATIAVGCLGKQQFPGQVWIEFVWKIKNFRRDPDNIAAAAKFVMDGLVEGGIIKDDSLKFIMSPVLHWYKKGKDLVEIRVADHPIWNGQPLNLEAIQAQDQVPFAAISNEKSVEVDLPTIIPVTKMSESDLSSLNPVAEVPEIAELSTTSEIEIDESEISVITPVVVEILAEKPPVKPVQKMIDIDVDVLENVILEKDEEKIPSVNPVTEVIDVEPNLTDVEVETTEELSPVNPVTEVTDVELNLTNIEAEKTEELTSVRSVTEVIDLIVSILTDHEESGDEASKSLPAIVEEPELNIFTLFRLKEIANSINEQHEKCKSSPQTGLLHGRNAGEWLLKAKKLVSDANWSDWLKKNCQMSEKMAETYMAIAKNWLSF